MIRLDSRCANRVRLLACGATRLFAISYAAGVVADGVISDGNIGRVTVPRNGAWKMSATCRSALRVRCGGGRAANFQGVESYFPTRRMSASLPRHPQTGKELSLRGISDQLSGQLTSGRAPSDLYR